jgi:hypothetical protein
MPINPNVFIVLPHHPIPIALIKHDCLISQYTLLVESKWLNSFCSCFMDDKSDVYDALKLTVKQQTAGQSIYRYTTPSHESSNSQAAWNSIFPYIDITNGHGHHCTSCSVIVLLDNIAVLKVNGKQLRTLRPNKLLPGNCTYASFTTIFVTQKQKKCHSYIIA